MEDKRIKINGKLQEILLPGEQVCWEGESKRFGLLENDNRWAVIRKWIISAVVAGGLCALSKNGGGQNNRTVVIIVLLVSLCVILAPVAEWLSLQRYRYWITDRRAIMREASGEFYAMELDEIDAFQVLRGKTAGECLAFGSGIMNRVEKQMRWQATHPRVSDKDGISNSHMGVGMVFYSLKNSGDAVKCLSGKVTEILR